MSNTISRPLLEPYTLGDLPLRNRIVMAPLTRTRAANFGHVPTNLMREYYEQRATAGAHHQRRYLGERGRKGVVRGARNLQQ